MAYVIADSDYARLVEDLVTRFSTPESPVDADEIKLVLAEAGGVYPAICTRDPGFDWHEAPAGPQRSPWVSVRSVGAAIQRPA